MFIAVGTVPQTELIKGLIDTDEFGYIISDETMVTNQPGIFTAGDIRQKN